jgi:hypothetical protein
MKFLRGDLRNHRNGEDADENEAADGIAKVHGHRNRVASGLPERRREYLDDPEDQRDFRDLASFDVFGHADILCWSFPARVNSTSSLAAFTLHSSLGLRSRAEVD